MGQQWIKAPLMILSSRQLAVKWRVMVLLSRVVGHRKFCLKEGGENLLRYL